ncbi:MAG: site-2 protease family protein [Chloroflexi bacterium]|nr:site-2 protease family protein [Chloroflexota bacterium]
MFNIDFNSPGFVTHFLGFMLGFVLGTTFHEFMHAYSALRLGDTTAQRQGRITLNPAAHFDPFGFIMGVLLALGIGFIAWGRPVQVNPSALRYGRRGMSIVAFAGPITNLVFAVVLTIVYKAGEKLPGIFTGDVLAVLFGMISINVLLFAFNLVPIPPLDGFNILSGILPNYWTIILQPIYQYSLPILLGLVFFVPYIGQIFRIPLNPVGAALGPVIDGITRLLGL